jgi:hypothetical protein
VRLILIIHVLAGGLALASGYTALFSAKGTRAHRKAGLLFAVAMLAMCGGGLWITIAHDVEPAVNAPAAVMTAYLVVTGVATVRPPGRGARSLTLGALVLALTVGSISMAFGIEALSMGGTRNGMPAFPFFLFGTIGLIGALGDVRALRHGIRPGASRLVRHLWRMCCALLIAALSFFIGQAQVFPAAVRIPVLLAAPVLVVLVAMVYWLWRVRVRRMMQAVAV